MANTKPILKKILGKIQGTGHYQAKQENQSKSRIVRHLTKPYTSRKKIKAVCMEGNPTSKYVLSLEAM